MTLGYVLYVLERKRERENIRKYLASRDERDNFSI